MLGPVIAAELDIRWPKLASHPIARALAFSLAFHLVLFLTVELGFRLGLWNSSLFSLVALDKRQRPDPRLEAKKRAEAEKQEVVPIVFVEVDPAQASQAAPKDTPYYSTRNSLAGNLDTKIDSNVPKISGTQDRLPSTLTKPRSEPMPLQPMPSVARPAEPPQESKPAEAPRQETTSEAKAAPRPGDLAMIRPMERPVLTPKPSFSDAPASSSERPKPRRLAQVRDQQNGLVSEKMKQEGGVRRYSIEGLNVKATPFASYDRTIIEAIQNHWFNFLDDPDRNFVGNDTGKVVLTFRLNSDGSVTQMGVAESTVNDILEIICRRAVQEPAPFGPWPTDMRRLIGADYREVRFTFYYN
jgi:outer membrane biosynthesis protein TonB